MVESDQIGDPIWLIGERNRLMGEVGRLHNQVGQLRVGMCNVHRILGWLIDAIEKHGLGEQSAKYILLDDLRRAQSYIEAGWDIGKPSRGGKTT